MDLRIVKTKKNIREAFIQLRSKHVLEKIKVTELCEIAMINKTTFYKHYENIFALADEIENEMIISLMNNFEHVDSLFNEPESFVKGMYYAFLPHKDLIDTLFSGRINVLVNKAERQLKKRYSLNEDPEKEITMSFLLWGTAQVLMESNYDEDILLDTVANIVKRVIA